MLTLFNINIYLLECLIEYNGVATSLFSNSIYIYIERDFVLLQQYLQKQITMGLRIRKFKITVKL